MAIGYIEAIGINWPAVQCHSAGADGPNWTVSYGDIVWDAGDPLPSQEELDAWIAAHPDGLLTLTRYQFRKLFTLMERVAIDSAPNNTAIPANYRAMLITIQKDMELSGSVELFNPDTAAGLEFLVQLGLLTEARKERILANLPPL